jgi:hypothetical protein
MSSKTPNPKIIRLDGFSPSWIGPDPFKPGFAVGSETGEAAFTDESGNEAIARHKLSVSSESINGIAGFGDYLAAATRHEVSIFAFPRRTDDGVRSGVIPRGSHGVIASPETGQFLAPVGHDGIMIIVPTSDAIAQHRVSTFPKTPASFYRLCALSEDNGRHYFAAACRSAGVGILDMSTTNGEIGLRVGRLNDADIVDVAYLGTPDYPHAVAAAGLHGELLLCRDIVRQEAPITLHYKNLAGRVYRVFAGHGHIFLLTSKAVYVLGGLATRLVQPAFDDQSWTPIMTIPMQTVDATIVNNKWLLAIMRDEIHRYDLSDIDKPISNFVDQGSLSDHREPFHQEVQQDWTSRELAELAAP